jgi:hypothetical protein
MTQRSWMALVTAAAAVAMLALAGSAQAAFSDYAIESFSASVSTGRAGGHPDFTTSFELSTEPNGEPDAATRDVRIELPPGLTGNPQGAPRCTTAQLTLADVIDPNGSPGCPQDSQVGVTDIVVNKGAAHGGSLALVEPVYNMVPPAGDTVARFGFLVSGFPTFIDVKLRPERNYGLEAVLQNVSSLIALVSADTTFWGVPADPSHDPLRITPYEAVHCGSTPCTAPDGKNRKSGLVPEPFMTNPTRCDIAEQVGLSARSYAEPGNPRTATASLPPVTGCGLLDFKPRISLRPTTSEADSPSGMDVSLTLPQEGLEHPNLFAAANLKRTVVRLPQGLTLNPATATGLGACGEAQVGLISDNPIRFDSAAPSCPQSSKVGSAEIETPLLAKPLQGDLYLGAQGDNPFHTLLSGYLVAQGQGATIKLAGRFDIDPASGRITATFDESPQDPFESVTLHFKEGSRGMLVTPPACGSYEIDSLASPWSAADPFQPSDAETVSSTSAFQIASGPQGGACPTGQFDPELEAGTSNPLAGQFSPFLLRLTRSDGSQRLGAISVALPPGLLGSLAGLPYCPETALAVAAARSGLGAGNAELTSPSCPAASQIGTLVAGAGAGPAPLYVSTGKVYLAGPYGGAPLSLAIITPALAGPFDLGAVVVRAALQVSPRSARITAESGPLPVALHGIPLDLRDLRVLVDRPAFVLNPTNCEQMSFKGEATSEAGSTAPLAEPFRVGGCRGLGFKPRLSLKLQGDMRRGGNPSLRATLVPRRGDANVARAQVALSHSEFLDQSHIGTVCTRVQFAAERCPAKSMYGGARVITPLLDRPLKGPVYLRSSSHKLPDLVADLRGQIHIVLDGRIDSIDGGIRTTFAMVPDAPVSKFVLTMRGGKKGLLENSTSLCAQRDRAEASFLGQNGRAHNFRPLQRSNCGGGAKHNSHPSRSTNP